MCIRDRGFDFGDLMSNSAILMTSVLRAQITVDTYFIGLVPGLLATLLGTAAAGIGIFKRQTSQLFKELEA